MKKITPGSLVRAELAASAHTTPFWVNEDQDDHRLYRHVSSGEMFVHLDSGKDFDKVLSAKGEVGFVYSYDLIAVEVPA